MKKQLTLMILFVWLFLFVSVMPARADGPSPPPPPGHAQNGNQAGQGATGCPIDRTQGIIMALAICLAYAGFTLFKRGQSKENPSGEV